MANSIIHFLLFGLFYLYSGQIWVCACEQRVRFRGDYRLPVQHSYRGDDRLSVGRRYRGITAFRCGIATGGLPSFEAGCFRVLQGCLRRADSLSRGLPSSGAASLPGGLPSFEARCFRLLQGGGVIVSSWC